MADGRADGLLYDHQPMDHRAADRQDPVKSGFSRDGNNRADDLRFGIGTRASAGSKRLNRSLVRLPFSDCNGAHRATSEIGRLRYAGCRP